MWSNGRVRPTPLIFNVFSRYVDSLVHLHSVLKMPARGKSVLNCDWVLDGACKYWLQVELRNAVKNASSEFRHEQSRQQEEKKSKEKYEANRVVTDDISSLKVKRKRLFMHCSVQDSAEKLAVAC